LIEPKRWRSLQPPRLKVSQPKGLSSRRMTARWRPCDLAVLAVEAGRSASPPLLLSAAPAAMMTLKVEPRLRMDREWRGFAPLVIRWRCAKALGLNVARMARREFPRAGSINHGPWRPWMRVRLPGPPPPPLRQVLAGGVDGGWEGRCPGPCTDALRTVGRAVTRAEAVRALRRARLPSPAKCWFPHCSNSRPDPCPSSPFRSPPTGRPGSHGLDKTQALSWRKPQSRDRGAPSRPLGHGRGAACA